MDLLIKSVLENLMRNEAPSYRSLEVAGERDPAQAARALLQAASLDGLAASRSSWVPALMISARPGRGAARLYELAQAYTKRTGEVLDPGRMPGLVPILGASEPLGRLLVDHPEWADDLVGDPPPPPDLAGSAASFAAIREAQSRGMLSAVARELLGCPLETSLAELTGLADVCLKTALGCASEATGVSAPAMFALGQLAGGELGLSPAVDLVFVDGAIQGGKRGTDRARQIDRLILHLRRELEADSELGALYQLDFSERPNGVVAGGVAAALDYFANDAAAGERRLVERIRPLVADPALARKMIQGFEQRSGRVKLERVVQDELAYKRERAASVAADDLIRGEAGVCDLEAIVHVEWVASSGRRNPEGGRSILASLYALNSAATGASDSTLQLADAYSWLRRAEHSLQLMTRNSPYCFPNDPEGQLVLARCMGYREPEAQRARERLLKDRQIVQQAVENQFEKSLIQQLR